MYKIRPDGKKDTFSCLQTVELSKFLKKLIFRALKIFLISDWIIRTDRLDWSIGTSYFGVRLTFPVLSRGELIGAEKVLKSTQLDSPSV